MNATPEQRTCDGSLRVCAGAWADNPTEPLSWTCMRCGRVTSLEEAGVPGATRYTSLRCQKEALYSEAPKPAPPPPSPPAVLPSPEICGGYLRYVVENNRGSFICDRCGRGPTIEQLRAADRGKALVTRYDNYCEWTLTGEQVRDLPTAIFKGPP